MNHFKRYLCPSIQLSIQLYKNIKINFIRIYKYDINYSFFILKIEINDNVKKNVISK